jgi:hypothetical protein
LYRRFAVLNGISDPNISIGVREEHNDDIVVILSVEAATVADAVVVDKSVVVTFRSLRTLRPSKGMNDPTTKVSS